MNKSDIRIQLFPAVGYYAVFENNGEYSRLKIDFLAFGFDKKTEELEHITYHTCNEVIGGMLDFFDDVTTLDNFVCIISDSRKLEPLSNEDLQKIEHQIAIYERKNKPK